jgi:mRNA-degrading endonuclease RelE of RelBE toxin-antitoxin system
LPKPREKRENWRTTTLAKAKSVLQTPTFEKAVKKLKPNQKKDLDVAVKELMAKPTLGEQKKGDLTFLRVYKFKMNKQLTLLGYSFDDGTLILELMALGSHENFYRDIKRRT